MIRNATHEDVPGLVGLGRLMVAESPRYSRLTFAPDKLDRLFHTLIDMSDGFLMLAESDGRFIGIMAAMVTEHWMAAERVATDFGLYVVPTERGGFTAYHLVRRYLKFAQEHGAFDVVLGISTETNLEQASRFYTALGLRQFGLLFEVPHV